MSISEAIPYQSCGTTSGPGAFQGIVLLFDNGVRLSLTVPGQEPPNSWLAYLTPGQELAFNIFEVFAAAGRPFSEPVNLKMVNVTQQLGYLCSASTTAHAQRMVVDYIRLEN